MAKSKEEPVKKKRIPRQKLYPVLVWIAEIAAALLLAYGVSRAFFTSVTLQENSMAPTIEAGDTVLINRLAFSTFRGGSQDHWKVNQDTRIFFDNLKCERIY